jgi:hypothetical protein
MQDVVLNGWIGEEDEGALLNPFVGMPGEPPDLSEVVQVKGGATQQLLSAVEHLLVTIQLRGHAFSSRFADRTSS